MPSKSATKIIGVPWSFSQLWNDALHCIPENPMIKRDRIYASELGLPFIDRYLKMHAIPYSTPINERSKRKFSSGDCWEWIISLLLTVLGILKERQLKGVVELPGLLPVSGKLDFIAGGEVDWDKAKAEIKRIQDVFSLSISQMPKFIFHAIEHILPQMEKRFNKAPLKEVIFECKSISSYVSDRMTKTGKPMKHHVLQNLHYMLANKYDEGTLFCICKDDAIGHQFQITITKPLLKMYRDDVKQMTEYYNASNHKNPMKTLPPKEPEIYFDDELYKFTINRMGVEWSNYLELLYGYKTPEQFRDKWKKVIPAWSRVFKRCVTNEKMTPSNLNYIKEAKTVFPEWDKYVAKAKAAGAFDKDSEDDE